MFEFSFQYIIITLSVGIVLAQQDTIVANAVAQNPFSGASAVVVGVAMVAVGFMFTFFGRKLFKPTLFLSGMLVGIFITFTILVNIEPTNTDPQTGQVTSQWGNNRDWIYIGTCLAAGIGIGFLTLCLWKLGLFAIGAYGGFTLAMFILSWSSNTAIPNEIGRTVFVVIICLAGGILALLLKHHVVIVATAIGGAYAICFGIDCFAKSGFNEATLAAISSHSAQFEITNRGIYGLLVSMAVLAIAGILIQEKVTSRHVKDIGEH